MTVVETRLDRAVSVKLTRKSYEELVKAANDAKMNPSAYVRKLIEIHLTHLENIRMFKL